ncbi:hypothetical protein [Winogradskya humida]|uniref:LysR substrate binding domain-containing protein n=1 Tax=Winogradskya humida TaxID=113566 RepID=A0ABQ4A3W1_9ACTN|nr:hypothetical protein [Actinoplanes humidus]GIE25536.1 hypothetical protein Ahu01nite_086380 [Actinoplanes humidus]
MAVPTYAAAVLVCARTDLVGLLPARIGRHTRDTLGLVALDPPMDLPPLEISQAWHQRYDADGAHGWLRACVREVAGSLNGDDLAGVAAGDRG